MLTMSTSSRIEGVPVKIGRHCANTDWEEWRIESKNSLGELG